MELINHIDFWQLVINALITTFVVSALATTFTEKFSKGRKRKILTLIVAFLISIFSIDFNFTEWQATGLTFMFTLSFAVLFYQYLGGWVITWIFEEIKKKLTG